MLRDEHGMAAVGRLTAVLERLGGSDALGEQVVRMRPHRAHAAQLDKRPIAAAQAKPGPERVAADVVDAFVYPHRTTSVDTTGWVGGGGNQLAAAGRG